MTRTSAYPIASRDGDPAAGALRASFDYCRRVTRRRARNFYYGMKLTPEPKRSAMYAIYAWMRAADDLADEPGDIDRKVERLERFRRQTIAAITVERWSSQTPSPGLATDHGDTSIHTSGGGGGGGQRYDGVWQALWHSVRQFDLPARYFHAVVDGQLLDQRKTRYATFAELYDYCHKVASVVGLVCIRVWGTDGDAHVTELAEHRGIALQLTNILRDLVEDARRDRVYVPADDLAEAGYDADAFAAAVKGGRVDQRFDRLMARQIERARGYYEKAATLERHLDPACRPTSWAMMRIYRGLLEKIARRPRRVLTQRVRLSSVQKLLIAMNATWQRGVGA